MDCNILLSPTIQYYYDNAVLYSTSTYNTVLSYSTGINPSVQYSTLAGGLDNVPTLDCTLAGMDCTLIQY